MNTVTTVIETLTTERGLTFYQNMGPTFLSIY